MIDEDAAHQVGREGQEVGAARPFEACLTGEAQIGFMDDGGRLKRVVVSFAAELPGGDASKLSVNQGEDLLRRRPVSCAPALQEICDGICVQKLQSFSRRISN
jgi:hypothetical protein